MSRPTYWTKEKLTELRRLYCLGLSMKEVGTLLNHSEWAIASVMKQHKIARRNWHETQRLQFKRSPLSFHPKTHLTPSEQKLKIAGLMLYWGEGAKTIRTRQVNLANTNPAMIKVFITFLREIYHVDESRLRCHLYCFKTQNLAETLDFWSNLTGIPKHQFIHPYISHKIEAKHAKIQCGVCHIVYSDKRLLQLILNEIDQLSKQLNSWGTQAVNGGGL